MKTFNAVKFLKFFKFWGLVYISNPHLIMWGLQPLTIWELRPNNQSINQSINKFITRRNLSIRQLRGRRRFAPTSCRNRRIWSSYCEFFEEANANTFFITEPNEDNIIQQLFLAANSCKAVCFTQFFSRCLFKHFKPRCS